MTYRVLAERDKGALRDRITGRISDLGSVGAEAELRREQETEKVMGSQCSCWQLNSEPVDKQPVLITAEPSLQPLASASLL